MVEATKKSLKTFRHFIIEAVEPQEGEIGIAMSGHSETRGPQAKSPAEHEPNFDITSNPLFLNK